MCVFNLLCYKSVCIPVCVTEYFSRTSRCFEFKDNEETCPTIGAATDVSSIGCLKTTVVRHQSTNMLAYSVQANTTDNQLSRLYILTKVNKKLNFC